MKSAAPPQVFVLLYFLGIVRWTQNQPINLVTLVYFSGTIDLFHFVDLSLPVIPRMSKKKIAFYKKTNLLLPFLFTSNEREGIPANLIQHLDVCVEIPQQGIVRSLNVHVSGALLIWEYIRQQRLKQGGSAAWSPRRVPDGLSCAAEAF